MIKETIIDVEKKTIELPETDEIKQEKLNQFLNRHDVQLMIKMWQKDHGQINPPLAYDTNLKTWIWMNREQRKKAAKEMIKK